MTERSSWEEGIKHYLLEDSAGNRQSHSSPRRNDKKGQEEVRRGSESR